MMTIEGVLCRKGPESILYSPKYFTSAVQLANLIYQGGVLLYGQATINYSPTAIVIDANDVFIRRLTLGMSVAEADRTSSDVYLTIEDDTIYLSTFEDDWVMTDPPIPPEKGWISETDLVSLSNLRNRYLAAADACAPSYWSYMQNESDFVIDMSSANAGTNDLVFCQKNYKFNVNRAIYFVNGLCCYPTIVTNTLYGESARLTYGRKYLANQEDRHRGITILDFTNLCDLKFVRLTDLIGTDLSTLRFPDTIETKNKSFLLVLDGRLYLPEEFTAFGNQALQINQYLHRPEYTLDRKCCENDFISKSYTYDSDGNKLSGWLPLTRNLRNETVDLKNAANSFVVIFDKTGLQVVKHEIRNAHRPQIENDAQTLAEDHRLIFPPQANGLLFDQSTRSIHDYTREENDMTSYAVSSQKLERWASTLAYVRHETPLEMWANNDNDMSASASMHDRKGIRGSAFVLWPRFTLLDFFFKDI